MSFSSSERKTTHIYLDERDYRTIRLLMIFQLIRLKSFMMTMLIRQGNFEELFSKFDHQTLCNLRCEEQSLNEG